MTRTTTHTSNPEDRTDIRTLTIAPSGQQSGNPLRVQLAHWTVAGESRTALEIFGGSLLPSDGVPVDNGEEGGAFVAENVGAIRTLAAALSELAEQAEHRRFFLTEPTQLA
jgi:hypothetical protein